MQELEEDFQNTFCVDVFALGTILYYLNTKCTLKSQQDILEIRFSIEKEEEERIIDSCLKPNWKERITIDKLCEKAKSLF